MTSAKKIKTIDDYLAALPADKRSALEQVRRIVRSAAPGVEEAISYNLPSFRLAGRTLLWIGATANHCALYGLRETRPGELAAYDTSGKGTIRFAPGKPLPSALVRRLVKARVVKGGSQAGGKVSASGGPASAPKRRA